MKELKDTLKEHKEDMDHVKDNYVSIPYFHAITKPLQQNMAEIQRDIKSILILLSKNEPPRASKKPTN